MIDLGISGLDDDEVETLRTLLGKLRLSSGDYDG